MCGSGKQPTPGSVLGFLREAFKDGYRGLAVGAGARDDVVCCCRDKAGEEA